MPAPATPSRSTARVIAFGLAAVLLVSVIPLLALAQQSGELLYAIVEGEFPQDGSELLAFPSDEPTDLQARSPILVDGEETITAVALDVRPATGELYVIDDSDTLYTVSMNLEAEPDENGQFFADATEVGELGVNPAGTVTGFDFNPVVDRIRVLTDADQNLRVNPEDPDGPMGTIVDGPLAYDDGTAAAPQLVGAAYESNTAGATATTLYDIDEGTDTLVTQDPANDGSLQTVGALQIDAETSTGFDISGSGIAYVRYRDGDAEILGTVDLDTGEVEEGETITSAFDLTGLAAAPADGPGPGAGAGRGRTTRFQGGGRTETALLISQGFFGDGEADAVVLSRPDIFPDALTGTPLAAQENGPLLLTEREGLEQAVATEIERVLPESGTVYLLGGTEALSDEVLDDVEALGFTAVRYGGANRFATAAIIGETGLGSPEQVLAADGSDFPDAVSAGAAAGAIGGAVILTGAETVPDETQAYLDEHDPSALFAVGGPAAEALPEATRLVGATRIGTSVAVATRFFTDPPVVGIATGETFPDALAGGAAVAQLGGPLLLTGQTLDPAVRDYLEANADSIDEAFLFGGTDRLPQAVEDDVAEAIGG